MSSWASSPPFWSGALLSLSFVVLLDAQITLLILPQLVLIVTLTTVMYTWALILQHKPNGTSMLRTHKCCDGCPLRYSELDCFNVQVLFVFILNMSAVSGALYGFVDENGQLMTIEYTSLALVIHSALVFACNIVLLCHSYAS